MAIVVYKCNECKREKEFQRNIEGLENIQRCTITHGCRGKLYQVKVLDDYIRAAAPSRVAGLDDWRQRKVLHDHTQAIARTEWLIEHNLGVSPAISAFVNIPTADDPDNIEELLPTDIIIVDDDRVKLVFDRPWSGLAQLLARQSDPDLLRPFVRTVDTASVLQQISNDGVIVIATRVSTVGDAGIIDLLTTYVTTQNTTVDNQYEVSVNSGLSLSDYNSSSWSDLDLVVIRGKIYTIRAYNGIISEMADETISTGSTMSFSAIIDYTGSPLATTARNIAQDEVYILFASSPYETVDKVSNQYIDVFDIVNTDTLVYNTGEFFIQDDLIQKIYPPIQSVNT